MCLNEEYKYMHIYLAESEIAEVLYKQDVDLGFSLDQEQIINASYASGNSATNGRTKDSDAKGQEEDKEGKKIKADEKDKHATNDDIEKLKALEEIQQDKTNAEERDPSQDLDDLSIEWNGVPFTIDNETVCNGGALLFEHQSATI
ncbi:hypothetical protein ACLKA6_016535 [Drosophila palustris]